MNRSCPMGLKLEYRRKSDKKLTEEHWDAESFLGFTKSPSWPRMSQRVAETLYGKKQMTLAALPSAHDAIETALVTAILTAMETAVLAAIATCSTTLVVTLPSWVPSAILVVILGDLVGRACWKQLETKLMNLRLVCPTDETFDALNHYFQGTWE